MPNFNLSILILLAKANVLLAIPLSKRTMQLAQPPIELIIKTRYF